MPSIENCMNNVEYSFSDVTRTYNFVKYDKNYLWFDYTFNVTQLVSTTIADLSQYCSLALLQGTQKTVAHLKLFGNPTDWVLGFLQNMLGNVISFQKIYDKINNSLAKNNYADVAFQVGRLMNLMLIFDPIEDVQVLLMKAS